MLAVQTRLFDKALILAGLIKYCQVLRQKFSLQGSVSRKGR